MKSGHNGPIAFRQFDLVEEPDRWPTVPDADLDDGSHTALGETFPTFSSWPSAYVLVELRQLALFRGTHRTDTELTSLACWRGQYALP